jgi:hypothetical protein
LPNLLITLDVRIEFIKPECSIAFWFVCKFAPWVTMPEAPVNKNDRPVFPEYDIGTPKQTPVVKAESKTQPV